MKEIFEITCKWCGKHIAFTFDRKYAEQEVFCSAKCVKAYDRKPREKRK